MDIATNKLTLKITNSLVEENCFASSSLTSSWFLKEGKVKKTKQPSIHFTR